MGRQDFSTLRGRLTYVMETCGVPLSPKTGKPNQAAFCRWVGIENPQTLTNWTNRDNAIPAAPALKIQRTTGADAVWLQDGAGEAFPAGPIPYPDAAARAEARSDAILAAVFILCDLAGSTPALRKELHDRLLHARKGRPAAAAEVLDGLAESLERKPGQSSRKTPRTVS